MTVDLVAVADEAARTFESARFHKRESSRHRRQAQRLMEKYDRLRDELRRHGIALEIETTTQTLGGHSHEHGNR